MTHLKRSKVPKTWPVPRKGTTFVAVASHSKTKGIPLMVLMRDVLKVARTRKEVRFMTLSGSVKVNNKARKDEAFPIQVFDVISFGDKNYRLEIVNKRFQLKEAGKDADKKVVKIVGKKVLSKDKVQMNLQDGMNFISKEKFSLGDSVVVNTKKDKIEKVLPLKAGANVEVISGKHAGEKGSLKEVKQLERIKMYLIKLKEKEVSLPLRTLLVIE